MRLWVVPARLAGWWCGGKVGLHVRQHFQRVAVTLLRRGQAAPAWLFDGRATADGLHHTENSAATTVLAQLEGNTLRLARVAGVAGVGFEGRPLQRSAGACFSSQAS